jgi:hypothetical protein
VGKAQRATIPPGYSALSPSITANALGGDIGKLWERCPSALWMALETQTHTSGRS